MDSWTSQATRSESASELLNNSVGYLKVIFYTFDGPAVLYRQTSETAVQNK